MPCTICETSQVSAFGIESVYYRWNDPVFSRNKAFETNILRKKYVGNTKKFEKVGRKRWKLTRLKICLCIIGGTVQILQKHTFFKRNLCKKYTRETATKLKSWAKSGEKLTKFLHFFGHGSIGETSQGSVFGIVSVYYRCGSPDFTEADPFLRKRSRKIYKGNTKILKTVVLHTGYLLIYVVWNSSSYTFPSSIGTR